MKQIVRGLLVGVVISLAVRPVVGQQPPPEAASPVQVDLDYSAFAYDGEQSLLEIYLAFGAESLSFEPSEQGFRASLPVVFTLVRNTDATLTGTPVDPVWEDTLAILFFLPDTSALAPGQYFLHQTRTPVQPGEYELRVAVEGDEQHGRQHLELRRDVLVPDYTKEELVSLSDITLASSITPSENRTDPFYKNGLAVRPNANQLYGQGLNELFYYAEVYNAEQIAGEDEAYTVFVYVAEANRPQPLPGLQKRADREARSPDVLVGSFELDELPSGSYYLRLAVLNEDNEAVAEQARKFFVFNPNVEREQTPVYEMSFETNPYATMTEEEVEKGLEHIAIIATDAERRRARDIQDLDEKRRFLMEFWQKRDPNPSTPINEYRDEFYGRLQYVNERYSTNFQEGWRTDRGRVFIKYGPPSQIQPNLYERDTVPHEIWNYNNIPGEGQAFFVFADRSGFGDFELLHSSVTGERKAADWQAELRR